MNSSRLNKMNALKQERNQFIKVYDEYQEKKDVHDRIISYYQNRYREISRIERPLTQITAYEEIYLVREFEVYKRTYESYYNKLCQYEEQLSIKIAELNEKLGYELDDLSSDEE